MTDADENEIIEEAEVIEEEHLLAVGPIRRMALDAIKPYWRNPRRVPEEAVNALVESFKNYGYRQPIVVDVDGVIIIGHTRYAALRKAGVAEIPVLIADNLDENQVKELRVMDNKVSEYTGWDFEALVEELEGMDASLRAQFFPDVPLSTEGGEITIEMGGMDEVAAEGAPVNEQVGFVCPRCFHSWEMKVTRAAIFRGKLQVSA